MNSYYSTNDFYEVSSFCPDVSFVLKEGTFSFIKPSIEEGVSSHTPPTLSFRQEEPENYDLLEQASEQVQSSTQQVSQGVMRHSENSPCLTWEQQKCLFDSPYLNRPRFLRSPYLKIDDF